MKVTYDPQRDTLHIRFRNAPISETENHRPGLILDYDQRGHIVSLELATASEHISHLPTLDVEHVTASAGDEMGDI